MIHVLFDTNIYGLLIADPHIVELADHIAQDKSLMIHNFRLIRNELRHIPKILPLYNRLVTNRMIEESKDVNDLAAAYFERYKANGGTQGKRRIMNDFKIVACASLKRFDLIFTEDRKTMQNPAAVQGYKLVNLRRNLRTLLLLCGFKKALFLTGSNQLFDLPHRFRVLADFLNDANQFLGFLGSDSFPLVSI